MEKRKGAGRARYSLRLPSQFSEACEAKRLSAVVTTANAMPRLTMSPNLRGGEFVSVPLLMCRTWNRNAIGLKVARSVAPWGELP